MYGIDNITCIYIIPQFTTCICIYMYTYTCIYMYMCMSYLLIHVHKHANIPFLASVLCTRESMKIITVYSYLLLVLRTMLYLSLSGLSLAGIDSHVFLPMITAFCLPAQMTILYNLAIYMYTCMCS